MSLIRLEPIIYLYTPLGVAEAHFYEVPEGVETHPMWHTFQVESKEPWVWPNPLVRICDSVSGMRDKAHSPIVVDEEYLDSIKPHIMRHQKSPLFERAWHKSIESATHKELVERGLK